jgi:tryptophanyl-tRNA synthetase
VYSTIFVQSQVPAHAELCWLLNCVTPFNWLTGMIQFKEKSAVINDQANSQHADVVEDVFAESASGKSVSTGLFDYPVLMAADILLYQVDFIRGPDIMSSNCVC